MKVRMRVAISGTRSGQEWPQPGAVLDCSPEEGAQLCASGNAVPVPEDDVETAVAPVAETRTRARKE
jgi:hypothetical protein